MRRFLPESKNSRREVALTTLGSKELKVNSINFRYKITIIVKKIRNIQNNNLIQKCKRQQYDHTDILRTPSVYSYMR